MAFLAYIHIYILIFMDSNSTNNKQMKTISIIRQRVFFFKKNYKIYKNNTTYMRLAITLCIFLTISLQSCNSTDQETVNEDNLVRQKVKTMVENFFSVYKSEDILKTFEFYPNIINLKGDFRKSSSIDLNIDDIIIFNDVYIVVNLTHHWVNAFGVDYIEKIILYVTKKGDTYKILDSKNFCLYNDIKLYNFALKTGAIDIFRDTTDITISDKIASTTELYNLTLDKIETNIKYGLQVNKGWKWESSYYSDYATGGAIVTNNSLFPIKNPRYIVTYKYDNGAFVTSDEGYVCYDVIMPGESRSFSWYTPYIGNATKANLKVVCDDKEWVEEIIVYLPFNGMEYSKYRHSENWWPL